ncbi:hypothetical protein A7G45_27570 [Mycolicibacterium llatzerense]|nr:hypothetical protein [Mycolicibacterium llatzerense]
MPFGVKRVANVLISVVAVSVVSACGHTVVAGRPLSARFDPQRVSGLTVSDGPSGPRPDGPAPTGRVANTDNGSFDRLALLAINDVESFWKMQYPKSFGEQLKPVSRLVSSDGDELAGYTSCGSPEANAVYCTIDNSIGWDRSQDTGLVPPALPFFGTIGAAGVFAHEYGHAVQFQAGLPIRSPTLIREQQADCYAGVYMRWVADGDSTRFVVSTGDGLNHLLAGLLAIRDPQSESDDPDVVLKQHGTGLDRVSAFQLGFEQGAHACSAIDRAEIQRRRGDLPRNLFDARSTNSDMAIDQNTLATLAEELQKILQPANPPALTIGGASCGGRRSTAIAAYCPDTNTVAIDLPALQQIGAPADEHSYRLLQGDNTAISVIASRYALANEHERGLPLDTPQTAMRTACLAGVAQRGMAQPISLPSGPGLTLGAGDLDEAVAGLLTNGIVASDVNGTPLPAGFTRIAAFRIGILGTADDCFRRF